MDDYSRPAIILSPDCRSGANCHKCDGTAWDETADAPTSCACGCHAPRRSARSAVGMYQDPRTL